MTAFVFGVACLKDDEEPSDAKYSPDGGYIPRILFIGRKLLLLMFKQFLMHKKCSVVA